MFQQPRRQRVQGRDREEQGTPGFEEAVGLGKKPPRVADVFDHVAEHANVVGGILAGQVLRVGMENLDPAADPVAGGIARLLRKLDPGDGEAAGAGAQQEVAVPAADL